MFKYTEVADLMESKLCMQVDKKLLNAVEASLYQEDAPILARILTKEINSSVFSLSQIESYIRNNEEKIVNFGIELTRGIKNLVFPPGISITYTIYLLYLESKDDNEFLSYLKQKNIQNQKTFLKELKDVYRSLNLNEK